MQYEHVEIEDAIEEVCRIADCPKRSSKGWRVQRKSHSGVSAVFVVSKAVEMTKNVGLTPGSKISSKIASVEDIEESAGVPSIKNKKGNVKSVG